MACTVTIANGRLHVRTDYAYKPVCQSIPGARWDRDARAWTYPATPSAAAAIRTAFQNEAREWADEAYTLLDEADRMQTAQAHKAAPAEDLPPIPCTKTLPWLHQLRAYHFASNLSACMLALEMGVGKTKIAIDLLQNRGCKQTLVLCPKSVVHVWPAELEKHGALDFAVLPLGEGSMIDRARKLRSHVELARVQGRPAVVIVNYDAIWREPLSTYLLQAGWDAVICDESHRIKSPSGRAANLCSRLGDVAPVRLCLTGTPMPHSPLDAYAQYRFLDKGIYGTSYTAFRARYAILGGYGQKQIVGYQNQDELQAKFYSIAYRVKSDDVLSLPNAVDVVRPVLLAPFTRKLYTQLREEFHAGVGDGSITASNALTRLLRLQQIAGGWAKVDRSVTTGDEGELLQVGQEKQDVLADLLEDFADAEPVVIFCRFHHDLDAVHTVGAALGRQTLELSGRRNDLAAWQEGAAPLLAVQIQSGGVGINLVRARYCVFYSLGFSLGEYLQARKRTHRPGQKHHVTYYHLIATDTVDVQVYRALEARQDVVETILTQERGESWPQPQRIS